MTVSQLLAILLALPPHYLDTEQPEARGPRLHRVAVAIRAASGKVTCPPKAKRCRPLWRGSRTQLEWALVTQGRFESHFAQHIHENRCRPQECDRGRARSPWQLQRGYAVGPETWHRIGGSGQAATSLAAEHAARVFARAHNRCRSMSGAFSLYATGKTCDWAGASKRLAWMQRQRRKWGL